MHLPDVLYSKDLRLIQANALSIVENTIRELDVYIIKQTTLTVDDLEVLVRDILENVLSTIVS